ncbi:MAG: YjbQ family protein, partial [Desulfonatronovibrio sp.]
MKTYRQELWMNVPARMDFVNITGEVQKAVDNSGVKEGMV